MERSTRIAFAYALAFLGFLVLPAAFRSQAPWPFPSGLYWQEVLDLLTPVVLIPLSWALCGLGDERTSRTERFVFLVLAALWVEGQGIHLAANSIARPWEQASGPTGALAQYYDDILSHYVWHAAIDGIWALALVRSLGRPFGYGRFSLALAVPAVLMLGVAWFLVVVESGTWAFDVPFTVLALGYVFVRSGLHLRNTPVGAVLSGGFVVSLLLMAGWAALWGGSLPEFSEVGWL